MEAPGSSTYVLRMGRQTEMVRPAPRKYREQVAYHLRTGRQAELVRPTLRKHENNHVPTEDRQSEMVRSTYGSIENDHVRSDDGQTSINGQVNFTEASRTIAHLLRMGSQAEMFRSTSRRH